MTITRIENRIGNKNVRLKVKMISYIIDKIDLWFEHNPNIKPFFSIIAFPDKYASGFHDDLEYVDTNKKLKVQETTIKNVNTKIYPKRTISGPKPKPRTYTKEDIVIEEVIKTNIIKTELGCDDMRHIGINFNMTNEPPAEQLYSYCGYGDFICEKITSNFKELKVANAIVKEGIVYSHDKLIHGEMFEKRFDLDTLLTIAPIQLTTNIRDAKTTENIEEDVKHNRHAGDSCDECVYLKKKIKHITESWEPVRIIINIGDDRKEKSDVELSSRGTQTDSVGSIEDARNRFINAEILRIRNWKRNPLKNTLEFIDDEIFQEACRRCKIEIKDILLRAQLTQDNKKDIIKTTIEIYDDHIELKFICKYILPEDTLQSDDSDID